MVPLVPSDRINLLTSNALTSSLYVREDVERLLNALDSRLPLILFHRCLC